MCALNVVAKTIGAAAVAAIGYDVVANTKRRAIYSARTDISNELTHAYLLNNTTGTGSPLMEKARRGFLNWRVDDNVRDSLVFTKNIVKVFFSNLGANAVGLTLGIGALLTKTGSKVPGLKGFIPKPLGIACAVGAAIVVGGNLLANLFPDPKTSSLDIKL